VALPSYPWGLELVSGSLPTHQAAASCEKPHPSAPLVLNLEGNPPDWFDAFFDIACFQTSSRRGPLALAFRQEGRPCCDVLLELRRCQGISGWEGGKRSEHRPCNIWENKRRGLRLSCITTSKNLTVGVRKKAGWSRFHLQPPARRLLDA